MPVARRAVRQVSLNPLPGVRKRAAETPESMGAGVARAQQQVGQSIAQFGGQVAGIAGDIAQTMIEQERKRADDVALLEAANQLDAWENETLWGDGTAEHPGAMSRRSKNALGLPEEVGKKFGEIAGEIEAGLSTDEQRLAFQKLKGQRWQNVDVAVRRHVFKEMTEYEARELEATKTGVVSNAIRHAQDPRRVHQELQRGLEAIMTSGPRLGLVGKALDEEMFALGSDVHEGVVVQLLATEKPKAAAIYFEATSGQIAGNKLKDLQTAIDEGSLREQSQKKADEIFREGGNLADMREKARAIDDAKLRDEVMRRLEHEHQVGQVQKREADEGRLRGAYDVLDGLGDRADVTKINPFVWGQLDGNERSALHAYAKARTTKTPIQTDIVQYYGLMRQAAEDPQAFATRNLLQFRHKLDEAEFKQLAGLQLSIRSGDARKAEADLGGFRTNQQIVTDALELRGFDPNPKNDTAAGRQKIRENAQFMRIVDQQVEALQQSTGKKATNDDIRTIADRVISQFSRPEEGAGWFFDGPHKPARLFEITLGDIPQQDRLEAEAALRARGIPISDGAVISLYLFTHKGGK
jgi:hypothetical protein